MVLAFGSVSLKFIQVGDIGRRVSINEVYSGRWYYRCGTVPLKYYSGRWLWHMGHCHWSSNDLILGQRALMTDSAVRTSDLEQTVCSINKLNCIMNMIILITACWLAAMIVMLSDICLCLYVFGNHMILELNQWFLHNYDSEYATCNCGFGWFRYDLWFRVWLWICMYVCLYVSMIRCYSPEYAAHTSQPFFLKAVRSRL